MKKSTTKPLGATSYKETSFGIISRPKLLKLELKGTKKGLDYVHDLIVKNPAVEIAPQLILEVHRRSFGWIFPDWAGGYRTIRVEFSGKESILPHQISELITNLCDDLNERLKYLNPRGENFIEEVVGLLAWFQHRFVWIHPFQDYNGRTARMLTILILLKLNLPPIEIKAETGSDRKKYLEAMYAADEGNSNKLETLIGTALNESLAKITAND
ncbi:MAG: hypothetical protein UY21_C0008G0024 [Microgenomates group bacterium GW2011_GWA1_48_10]|uniref:Fido domain-containing protein n=1 Tax=Candidatus Gottesmanbacteria bacterium RIFCSPHIGHO2_01_FULL_47_48 TaxID=1798381 RepID=A0A1F6A3F5_9BACT|nr:MAG: hypothetical protein UY21_C0008G0024 [Microgenomates group bacterium GW2011_GWA1_48_10]OGG19074.1 MAG: hypothetical protein A2721_00745 [Candidatus Gottesmanbacteria bacterium RIFCSPHIGHO2_01_FULL_47_48]